MIVVMALYPFSAVMRFDEPYYLEKHIGLVKEIWAEQLDHVRVLSSDGEGSGEQPRYRAITEMAFASPEALEQAMAHPRVPELLADIPNFTDTTPLNQIAQIKL